MYVLSENPSVKFFQAPRLSHLGCHGLKVDTHSLQQQGQQLGRVLEVDVPRICIAYGVVACIENSSGDPIMKDKFRLPKDPVKGPIST